MKKNSHPEYQEVLFVDSATGFKFVCGTTQKSEKFETLNGVKYPVVDLAISSSSHPFFVGGKQIIDAEGRVDRFTRRYQEAAARNKAVVKEEPVVESAAVTSKKKK